MYEVNNVESAIASKYQQNVDKVDLHRKTRKRNDAQINLKKYDVICNFCEKISISRRLRNRAIEENRKSKMFPRCSSFVGENASAGTPLSYYISIPFMLFVIINISNCCYADAAFLSCHRQSNCHPCQYDFSSKTAHHRAAEVFKQKQSQMIDKISQNCEFSSTTSLNVINNDWLQKNGENNQRAKRKINKDTQQLPSIASIRKSINLRSQPNLEKSRAPLEVVPKHVAFICDGNSRWAKKRSLPTSAGHMAGADRLVDIFECLKKIDGISYCTMYAFSTENWKRPRKEVDEILNVMYETTKKFYHRIVNDENNVRVKILGDLHDDRIPSKLRDILMQLEKDTAFDDDVIEQTTLQAKKEPLENQDNIVKKGTNISNVKVKRGINQDLQRHKKNEKFEPKKLTVCFALNYGGRSDILTACKLLSEAAVANKISPDDITEDMLASYLCTTDVPDPDMIIRTSGEQRLSNFLLWNSAYSELYFTEALWPDFSTDRLFDALQWYSKRKRSFGGR